MSTQKPSAFTETPEELIAKAQEWDIDQNTRLDTQKLVLTLAEVLKKERESRAVSAAIIREQNLAMGAMQAVMDRQMGLWARVRRWLSGLLSRFAKRLGR